VPAFLFLIPGIIGKAANWLLNTKVGRIVGLIVGALLLLKFVDWRAERRGRAEMKDYVEKSSNEAARKRRDTRDEIDLDVSRVGAAERVRNQWTSG